MSQAGSCRGSGRPSPALPSLWTPRTPRLGPAALQSITPDLCPTFRAPLTLTFLPPSYRDLGPHGASRVMQHHPHLDTLNHVCRVPWPGWDPVLSAWTPSGAVILLTRTRARSATQMLGVRPCSRCTWGSGRQARGRRRDLCFCQRPMELTDGGCCWGAPAPCSTAGSLS